MRVTKLLPAVDLIEGTVVRLQQGDYDRRTDFAVKPADVLSEYVKEGATQLHLVDLTGAKDTTKRQTALIESLVKTLHVTIEVGGGIRSESDVEALLNAGVSRVVIGSLAVKKPEAVKALFKRFGGETIVLALDVSLDSKGDAYVATDAWQSVSSVRIEDVIDRFAPLGLQYVLCTDIARDGMLKGANTELYRKLCGQYPAIGFIASGGIGSLDDIRALAGLGLDSIIVGRALLENRFTVKEALRCLPNESLRV